VGYSATVKVELLDHVDGMPPLFVVTLTVKVYVPGAASPGRAVRLVTVLEPGAKE